MPPGPRCPPISVNRLSSKSHLGWCDQRFHNANINPLVKPVRTPHCTLCFTLLAATLVTAHVTAQDTPVRRSVRQSEQNARAQWQPVRQASVSQEPADVGARTARAQQASGSVHQASNTSAAQRRPATTSPTLNQARSSTSARPAATARPQARLKQVDHSTYDGESVPATHGPSIVEMPMDGQIMYEPLHDTGFACDAMGGCGSPVCDGGCDSCSSGGCAVGGCGGCATGCDSCCGELCGSDPWRPCLTLCLPQDGWVSFEYLAWWQDGMNLPPLITTSTDNTTPQAQAGVLGQGSTRTLFGGNRVLTDPISGGRLRFGVWLDKCHQWGLGAEYFQIGEDTESFRATSGGTPILARPFFNTQLNREDSELIAFPNVVSGTGGVDVSTELVGWGVHLRHLRQCNEGCNSGLFCGCPEHFCSRTEVMVGYRNLQLTEGVGISEDLVGINPANNFAIRDQFNTRNQFSGLDLGWMYRRTRGYWTFDSTLRLALGNTRQTIRIDGTTRIDNGPVQQGGLLAQSSNIGFYKNNEFSVVPEIDLNLGYQLTDHLRLIGGYTFIYWSNVVRPGDQISRDLNTDLLPPPNTPIAGAARPEFKLDTTDYWVQGLNFGAEYRW